MNLKQLLFLKACAKKEDNVNFPGYFSAVGGNGAIVPVATNNYGTTLSTTSAEENSVTVTQVYDSSYQPISYRNGYVNVGFDKMTTWIDEGATLTFTADIEITANPAEVEKLQILFGSKTVDGVISDGKLTATSSNNSATQHEYVEIRCCGCSFILSNAILTKS